MAVLGDIRARARLAIAPVLGTLLFSYFSYHMVQGDRGLIAYLQLSTQLAAAQAVHGEIRAERDRLAHRVSLLKPDHLDPDMLEERARVMLNLAHRDDVVILRSSLD